MFRIKGSLSPAHRQFILPFSFRRDNEEVLNELCANEKRAMVVVGRFAPDETSFEGVMQSNLAEEMWLECGMSAARAREIEAILDTRPSFTFIYRNWRGLIGEIDWTSPHIEQIRPKPYAFEHGRTGIRPCR